MKSAGIIQRLLEEIRKSGCREDEETPSGWTRTRDLPALIGYETLAGVRLPLRKMVKAGFAEEMRMKRGNLAYRLSPKFKTWKEAWQKTKENRRFHPPKGWVSLSVYAKMRRRTVRGIQYRIDGSDISYKLFPAQRMIRHYRKADLDRLIAD